MIGSSNVGIWRRIGIRLLGGPKFVVDCVSLSYYWFYFIFLIFFYAIISFCYVTAKEKLPKNMALVRPLVLVA